MFFIVNFLVVFLVVLIVNILVEFIFQKEKRDKTISKKNIITSLLVALVITLYFFYAQKNEF